MLSVYRVFRNRRYCLFQLKDPQPLFQLLHNSNDHSWKSEWNSQQFSLTTGLKEQELSYGELTFLTPSIPLLHEQSIELLAPLLIPYGELLPMSSENGIYYAYHVLKPYHALNIDQSTIYPYPKQPMLIDKYDFHKEQVKEPLFFRLPQSPAPFFATDSFMDILEKTQFQGWQFEQCWKSE
ncbi:hypothetical protein SAMN05444392_11635 [Seinonella peptonophila]|uniref:Immunity MXAN-0049 protein domain-containing protein n=1 Tax=Seinonella peptonophila TaxID=112248 RepID=A0A1M5AVZ2_9BACL|nr:hypothetical protein [Seinonella peptonophila]SHF34424.1 hypothetical protein SAMN05444392_11635 [Seinonella peptonophila]